MILTSLKKVKKILSKKKNKQGLQKMYCERYQNLSKEEKIKNIIMVAKDIEDER